jgi:hypothetical protein
MHDQILDEKFHHVLVVHSAVTLVRDFSGNVSKTRLAD